MKLKNKTNHEIRNFGFGNRCPKIAIKNALADYYAGYSTRDNNEKRFMRFLDFHERNGTVVKDLRKINMDMMRDYGHYIKDQYSRGKLKLNSAHNYISAINNIMKIVRGDKQLFVSAIKDVELPKRSYIRTDNRASHKSIKELMAAPNSNANAMRLLQRSLGLRHEESAKANPKGFLKEALKTNEVTILDGTKGGQSRKIPITSAEQIEALERASAVQGENRSLIDKHKSYLDFSNKTYRENEEERFHDNRHAYAQDRYIDLTGADCPLRSHTTHGKEHIEYLCLTLGISIREARIKDKDARMQISKELGHSRIEITNSYLG